LVVADEFDKLLEQLLFSPFYLINVCVWQSVNYFALQAHNVSLLHALSLALEIVLADAVAHRTGGVERFPKGRRA